MQPTLSRRELLKQIALGSALVSLPAVTTKAVPRVFGVLPDNGVRLNDPGFVSQLKIKLVDPGTPLDVPSVVLNRLQLLITFKCRGAYYSERMRFCDVATATEVSCLAERNEWGLAEHQRTALRELAVKANLMQRFLWKQTEAEQIGYVLECVMEDSQQIVTAQQVDYDQPKARLSICWRDRDDGVFARARYPNAKQLLHLNFFDVYCEAFEKIGTGNQIYDPTRLEDGYKLLEAPTQFRFTEEEMAFYDFKVTEAIRATPAWYPLRHDARFLVAMNRNNERFLDGESQYQEFLDGRRLITPSMAAADWTLNELLADYGNELRRSSLDVSNG